MKIIWRSFEGLSDGLEGVSIGKIGFVFLDLAEQFHDLHVHLYILLLELELLLVQPANRLLLLLDLALHITHLHELLVAVERSRTAFLLLETLLHSVHLLHYHLNPLLQHTLLLHALRRLTLALQTEVFYLLQPQLQLSHSPLLQR
jgi:hypothetical protein